MKYVLYLTTSTNRPSVRFDTTGAPTTMASKPKKAAQKPDVELRRWCIEQAIRWPMIGPTSSYQQALNQMGLQPPRQQEANIIDRANRILAWVRQ